MSETIKNLEPTPARESFDTKLIEAHITKLLGGVELISKIKEPVKVKGIGKELKITTKVVALGFDIGVTATVDNTGSSIKVKDFDVDANPLVRGRAKKALREQLDIIPQKIKEYIETEEKQPIDKLWIEHGLLKAHYKQPEQPIMSPQEIKTEEAPEPFKDEKLEAEMRERQKNIDKINEQMTQGLSTIESLLKNIAQPKPEDVQKKLAEENAKKEAMEKAKKDAAAARLVAEEKAKKEALRLAEEKRLRDEAVKKAKATTEVKKSEPKGKELEFKNGKLVYKGTDIEVDFGKPEPIAEAIEVSAEVEAELKKKTFIYNGKNECSVTGIDRAQGRITLFDTKDGIPRILSIVNFVRALKDPNSAWKMKKEIPVPVETVPVSELVTPEVKYKLQLLMAEKLKYFYDIDVPVEKPIASSTLTKKEPAPIEKPKVSKAEPTATFEVKNTPMDISSLIGPGAEFESDEFRYRIVNSDNKNKIVLERMNTVNKKKDEAFISQKTLQENYDHNEIAFSKGPDVPVKKPVETLPKTGEYSKDWLETQFYIQRDSNDTYTASVSESKNRVALIKSDDPAVQINLTITDFLLKLKTPGSPWSIKPVTTTSEPAIASTISEEIIPANAQELTFNENNELVAKEPGAPTTSANPVETSVDKVQEALDFYDKLTVGTRTINAEGDVWEVIERDDDSITEELIDVAEGNDRGSIGESHTRKRKYFDIGFVPGQFTIIEKTKSGISPKLITVANIINATQNIGGIQYEDIQKGSGLDGKELDTVLAQLQKDNVISQDNNLYMITPDYGDEEKLDAYLGVTEKHGHTKITLNPDDLKTLNEYSPAQKEAAMLYDSLNDGDALEDFSQYTYKITKNNNDITLTLTAVPNKKDESSIGLSSTYNSKKEFIADALIMKYKKVERAKTPVEKIPTDIIKESSGALDILATYPELSAEITEIERQRSRALGTIQQKTTDASQDTSGALTWETKGWTWETDKVLYDVATKQEAESEVHNYYNEQLADLVAEFNYGGETTPEVNIPEGYRVVGKDEIIPAGDYETHMDLSSGQTITNAPKKETATEKTPETIEDIISKRSQLTEEHNEKLREFYSNEKDEILLISKIKDYLNRISEVTKEIAKYDNRASAEDEIQQKNILNAEIREGIESLHETHPEINSIGAFEYFVSNSNINYEEEAKKLNAELQKITDEFENKINPLNNAIETEIQKNLTALLNTPETNPTELEKIKSSLKKFGVSDFESKKEIEEELGRVTKRIEKSKVDKQPK